MKIFSFLALSGISAGIDADWAKTKDVLLQMLSEKSSEAVETLEELDPPKPLESVLLKPQKKPRVISKNVKNTVTPTKRPNVRLPGGAGVAGSLWKWKDDVQTQEMRARIQEQKNAINGKDTLQCLICNEQNYEKCYQNGRLERCYGGSCFLQIRYTGDEPSQVQSGCQQKSACINNMKQNFWQDNGLVNEIENAHKHQCKIFSEGKDRNSVCHTCCFTDYCTKGWKPKMLADFITLPGYSEIDHQILFDQYVRPPGAWTKDDYDPSTRNRQLVPVGGRKRPQMRNIINNRAPQTTRKPRPTPKIRTTQKPRATQKPRTTRKPVTKKPANQAMRFSLNVDKDGNVNQQYGKSTVDYKSRIASILNLDLGEKKQQQKKAKATKAPIRVIDISALKKPTKNPAVKAKPTSKPATTPSGEKKGPWSHLPPWKQRQLKRIRDQRLAAKAAEKSA